VAAAEGAADVEVAADDAAVGEVDVAHPAASPITAAAMIHRPCLFIMELLFMGNT
jgi:hypothetical protein